MATSDAHHRNLPKLRFVTSSSAPLVLEEWKRFEQRFAIPIAQGYGASEVNWIAAIPGEQRRLGTVGRPLAYHDLAIVGADGRRLPVGESGHVEIGGVADHPFRYLAEDGEVKAHSRGRIRTGDIGYLDADGFLTLTGREKELIIRGGAKISPVEIDSCLMQCAGVIEAATIGVPDAIYGEEVVSYVVTRPGAQIDAEVLLRYCGNRAAGLQGAQADRPEHVAAEKRPRQARPQGAGATLAQQSAGFQKNLINRFRAQHWPALGRRIIVPKPRASDPERLPMSLPDTASHNAPFGGGEHAGPFVRAASGARSAPSGKSDCCNSSPWFANTACARASISPRTTFVTSSRIVWRCAGIASTASIPRARFNFMR